MAVLLSALALLSMGTVSLAVQAPQAPSADVRESVRGSQMSSFKVMDVLARALQLESAGHHVCHLEVGQPQSGAPSKVLSSAETFLRSNRLGYTAAIGVDTLRNRISRYYQERYQADVSPEDVIVTTGSSGAFLLSFMSTLDPGDIVCIASAGYPCYRNILKALGCELLTVPINSEFKVTVKELMAAQEELQRTRGKKVRAIILSSPSNPTGAMLTPDELKDLCEHCDREGIQFFSDEIYHGISYGKEEATALKYTKNAIVINSFSKYYSMTGWRLGWLVAPKKLVAGMNRLQQNFYINAPTLSQLAAVDAFECTDELNEHVQKYDRNRKIILQGLKEIGWNNVAPADGAFYIYVALDDEIEDSEEFCRDLLEQAKVAITPGTDFEDPASGLGKKRLRFSYCGSTDDVTEGMKRLKAFWGTYPKKLK